MICLHCRRRDMVRLLRASLSLTVVCSLCASAPSSAEPQPASAPISAAQSALERGVRLYNVRRYADAIEVFRRGYEQDPDPQLLFAIGQAYRLAGDCTAAIESFRAYLRTGPLPHRAESASRLVNACEEILAKRPPNVAPPSTPLPPSTPTQVQETPPPKTPVGRRYAVSFSCLSLTVAALVAAATVQGLAGAEYDDLRGSCAPFCSDPRIDALQRKLDASIGLWATSGVAGLATLVAFIVETKRPRR